IGRSLMLPIAVLPAAGLLLRFGQADLLNIPWLADAGGAIFGNLPLLFAVGVAIGFTADVGTAGIAGAVGYWVFTKVLVDISSSVYGEAGAEVNMGVLAGILMGLLAAFLYERYHTIKLPEWLAFFGGKRFVPIITSFVALVLGIVFGLVWYWPEQLLAVIGNWATGAGGIGAAVHAFLNRLLIPFGLHHVINSIVWFQFGDLTNFFETGGAEGGVFMTGWFPIMMFGLPAAALAMYVTAKEKSKKLIGGVLFSAALTSLITGITEPIEFAFMFVAPLLYALHALLAAISAFVCVSLGIRSGFTFSSGLIDYILNYGISSKPLLLLVVGVVFGVIYYFLFVALIKARDIPTPGREPEIEEGAEA
ncbi:MAG: PTS transporter subunit EIIC, partial [Chloroflexi bacterium]|nr:PTS transporter subunit EIIC [Chloroflexota bacterium]